MNDETRTYDFTGWDEARAFVARTFPQAIHEGVGAWRIPRVARIHYGLGRIVVTMMRGHGLSELDRDPRETP